MYSKIEIHTMMINDIRIWFGVGKTAMISMQGHLLEDINKQLKSKLSA
ncbi:hypothetical protein [Paucisalibacillus sp. EB02]|nr:hypothetical protein [Paucisalibacillus sp. EB02]